MKQFFCLLLACTVFLSASAQNKYNSSGKSNGYKQKKKKGYDPDKLVLGGGINLGYAGDYANFGISPKVGYKLNNYLVVGAGLGYQYYKAPYDYYINDKVAYIHENIMSPSIWAKCPLFNFLVLSTDFEYDFINIRSYNPVYDQYGNLTYQKIKHNVSTPCWLVGGGIQQHLGGRTKALLEVMYDVLQTDYSPYRQQLVYRASIFVGL